MKRYFQGFEKPVAVIMLALSFFALWASLMHPILDGDIWFHLLYGREMLAQKTLILDHTQFSWSPASNDTIYCAWIGQILYYFLYAYLGEFGVIAFRYLACTIPFLALAHIAWQRGVFFSLLPWLAATLSVFILAIASLDKPELLSLIFMTILVWNWFQIRLPGPRVLYHVYLFPLLMLVWVNSHGIFIFGCVFLLLVGIGETCNQVLYRAQALPKKMYLHLCIALVLSLGAIFCTPYGFNYIQSIVAVHLSGTEEANFAAVTAWRETFSFDHPWYYIFANSAVVFILAVLFTALRKRHVDFVPVFENLFFAYFFTIHTRLIYLWIPIFLLTIAYYSPVIISVRLRYYKIYFFVCTIFFVCCFILLFYLLIYYPPSESWPQFGHSDRFIIKEEVDFIEKNYPNARLGNLYDEGAYILWRRWPQQKVMIDARYFPYKYWFSEYLQYRSGQNVGKFFKQYYFDLAIIPHGAMQLNYFFSKNQYWNAVFYSKGAVLYAHSGKSSIKIHRNLQRGEGLGTANNLYINSRILNSVLLLRDWQGYDLLLDSMRKRFTKAHQRTMIEGLAKLKPAILAYERLDYVAAFDLFEQANKLKAGYPRGLSAAALSLSILDWQSGNYADAVRKGMRALFAQESVPAIYNLAVMGWQLEQMRQNDTLTIEGLSLVEEKILAQWRVALQELVDRGDPPPEFQAAVENARKILSGDRNAKTLFLPENWM